MVKLLVQKDPDHSYPQNKSHETPLYLASIRHYKSIISIILDNCTSATFGGPDGRTALHAAVLTCKGGGKYINLSISPDYLFSWKLDMFFFFCFHASNLYFGFA